MFCVSNQIDLIILSDGKKNYFKDWCLINLQPTFLFLTYLNSTNYGYVIKCKPDNLELYS